MEPNIKSGDTVIVKVQQDIDSGEIGIVSIGHQEATCKKVIKSHSGVNLVSYNTSYDPMFYDNKQVADLPVTILGRVIELRRKFR